MLGQRILPVATMQPGYKHLSLRNGFNRVRHRGFQSYFPIFDFVFSIPSSWL